MSDPKFPEWQELYLEALMEFDQWKLPALVHSAEAALLFRLKTIQRNADQRTEKQAIEDALSGLTVLKRETAAMKASPPQPVDPDHSRVN